MELFKPVKVKKGKKKTAIQMIGKIISFQALQGTMLFAGRWKTKCISQITLQLSSARDVALPNSCTWARSEGKMRPGPASAFKPIVGWESGAEVPRAEAT